LIDILCAPAAGSAAPRRMTGEAGLKRKRPGAAQEEVPGGGPSSQDNVTDNPESPPLVGLPDEVLAIIVRRCDKGTRTRAVPLVCKALRHALCAPPPTHPSIYARSPTVAH